MKRLTVKEEEIMGWFWQKGPLFVKELLEYYEEPKPHFNTLLRLSEAWRRKVSSPIRISGIAINIMRS